VLSDSLHLRLKPSPRAAGAGARRLRTVVACGTTGLLATAALVLAPAGAAAAATPSCSAFDDPVYRAVKSSNNASLVTPSASEADQAAADGFGDKEVVFRASTEPGDGLVAVHRMYRPSPQDYLNTTSSAELASASQRFGYADEGDSFYASPVAADCLEPVLRYRKQSRHRLVTGAEKSALESAGWTYENVAFYAAPAGTTGDKPAPAPAPAPAPIGGSTFSFAVIPDTQNEVVRSSDTRLVNRNEWLVKQDKLAFAVQTGDLLNWDTPDHAQAAKAKGAMDILENAGVPYTVSIGNHDTAATGVGGSARDPANTRTLIRDTSTLNSYFKASDFGAVAGEFEPGKIDNVYSTYTAGGYQWMVLSLEFCPRPAVVAWAKKVVADHPNHNVLVSTHSYLDGGGGIDSSNQGYGDTSGQKLFDQLISQYPNIKMVFSGHVGLSEKARVDTGKNGNTIFSVLTTMHDQTANPVRMFDVDTANGTLKTRVYAPSSNYTWSGYTETLTGLQLVR